MFDPGDVVSFRSIEAGKLKHHLCISLNGHYLFINSPKTNNYPGDFVFECAKMPFIPPTASGDSIISCTLIMKKSNADLKRGRAEKKGSIPVDLLRDLMSFIENSPVITDEDREEILEGLGDWI